MSLLALNQVSKCYKKHIAVDNITFSLQEGDVLGLLGPNGAGKSTTISMIATLLKPDRGDILYRGESIIKNPKRIQGELGYVPQEIALYPQLSGYQNLMFFGKAYGIKKDQLTQRIDEVSKIIGIEERLLDKVGSYSGGMKRRLNIGAALLHAPQLLIMDEPTVGIDPQSRAHILETVLTLNKSGMTVIYTSHYMEEVQFLCNQICIMDKGQMIVNDLRDNLLSQANQENIIHIMVLNNNEQVKVALSQLACILDVSEIKKDQYRIVAIRDEDMIERLVEALKSVNAKLISIQFHEANLETQFLKLTGRALRD